MSFSNSLRGLALILISTTSLLTACSPGPNTEFRYRELGGNLSPAKRVTATAVNNSGHVAGEIDGQAFISINGAVHRYVIAEDGDVASIALAINNRDTAVGAFGLLTPLPDGGGIQSTAAVFSHGHTLVIDDDINASFVATSINDVGAIVGGIGTRGFIRRPDRKLELVQPLSTRGDDSNGLQLTAIDRAGDVVGASTIDVKERSQLRYLTATVQQTGQQNFKAVRQIDSSSYPVHAFVQFVGESEGRDIGHLRGFVDSIATAINNNRVVVGYSGNVSSPTQAGVLGASQAWIWMGGKLLSLKPIRDNDSSFAYGINDENVVVGCSGNRAVRWRSGKVQPLCDVTQLPKGVTLTCAHAISQTGWIVGDATNSQMARGFVLQPLNLKRAMSKPD